MKRTTQISLGTCPSFKVFVITFSALLVTNGPLLGGSFDPWAGPGYDACEVLTGPNFQDVFYKQNWASNAKLMSFYMLYGLDLFTHINKGIVNFFRGTSWGGLPFPGVYTRYVCLDNVK